MMDTILRKSFDLISAANTLTLPVDVRTICAHFRYRVEYYSQSWELITKLGIQEDAVSYPALGVRIRGRYFIFLSDDLGADQERLLIAHELGHIALGHLDPDLPVARKGEKGEQEEQADLFAIALLASPPLLSSHAVFTPEDIQLHTGLSPNDSRRALPLLEHYQQRQHDADIGREIARRAQTTTAPASRPKQTRPPSVSVRVKKISP